MQCCQKLEAGPRLLVGGSDNTYYYSREGVLEWLTDRPESEVLWVLRRLSVKRSQVYHQARNQNVTSDELAYIENTDHAQDTYAQELKEANPIIQFGSSVFITAEEQPAVMVDVIRIGNLSTQSKVQFETIDGSAISGKNFYGLKGGITFELGEHSKCIEVKLMQDDDWDTTLEFSVTLKQEGLINAHLGRYLYHTRVKVMNDDTFPTNLFRNEILNNNLGEVPHNRLLMEYFRMNFKRPVVKVGTVKMALADQLHNLYFILRIFMQVYLVDFVLAKKVDNREQKLIYIMMLMILPFAFLHYVDYRKSHWKVGGSSRCLLQAGLLRKFLNYDIASRERVDQGDLVMAITRDSAKLVHDGYLNLLNCIKFLGQIVMIVVFQLTAPAVFGKPVRFLNLGLLGILPLILGSFLVARRRTTTRSFNTLNGNQDDLVDHINNTAQMYRLIADFGRRSQVVEKFQDTVKEYNGSAVKLAVVLGNNVYFAQWLTILILASYTVIGGASVLSSGTSLGMFLSDLNVFKEVGASWGSIYKTILEMQTTYPALERIVFLMNLRTDLGARQEIAESNHKKQRALMAIYRPSKSELHIPVYDCLPLTLENLGFHSSEERNQAASFKICMAQGQLAVMLGSGKSTLLRIMGGAILPGPLESNQEYYVPLHLRVLHVTNEPLFFRGSLLSNIVFGVGEGDADGSLSRVLSIAGRLQVPDHICNLIETQETAQMWHDRLSQAEMQQLNIVRAFVANPEVLVIHKPSQVFDDQMAKHILATLKEFVVERGVCMDASSVHLRRPRTCIFSSNRIEAVKIADVVYHISPQLGFRQLDKEKAAEEVVKANTKRNLLYHQHHSEGHQHIRVHKEKSKGII